MTTDPQSMPAELVAELVADWRESVHVPESKYDPGASSSPHARHDRQDTHAGEHGAHDESDGGAS